MENLTKKELETIIRALGMYQTRRYENIIIDAASVRKFEEEIDDIKSKIFALLY